MGNQQSSNAGNSNSQESRETLENPQSSNASNSNPESSSANNIIINHDYSRGLHSWHPNCCNGVVVSGESGYLGVSANSGSNYVVIINRKECWQGCRVSHNSTYTVSACVRVSSFLHEPANVQVTLKLEYNDSLINYLFVGRASVSKERWEILTGTFSLRTLPKRVVFYLEGPAPGVDLLIDSVVVSSSIVRLMKTAYGLWYDDFHFLLQFSQVV